MYWKENPSLRFRWESANYWSYENFVDLYNFREMLYRVKTDDLITVFKRQGRITESRKKWLYYINMR